MNVTYQLVWQSCAEAPGLAERFFAPGFTGQLPFLLEGSSEAPDPSTFTEEELLKGLLTGLPERDAAGRLCLRGEDQTTLLNLVEVLRQGYSFTDYEEMVIETSGNLRARYDVRPSCAALSTGVLLAPKSSKIKADLILDLWAAARLAGDPDTRDALLSQIPSLFEALDAEAIPPGTLEACCYHTLAAKHLCGEFDEDGSLEDFLIDEVIERVSHPLLKSKIKAITEAEKAGERLVLADVHVD